MSSSPRITRRPLRLAHDAERDTLLASAYGAVPHPCLDSHVAGISDHLRFLLRRPGGSVVGFAIDDLSQLDVDEHAPSLWDGPVFDAPVLGLRKATVAEIILRARTTFTASTADVLAMAASRELAAAGEHAAAEGELRCALGCGDLRAHLTLAGCLYIQGRYAAAYDHARIYTELAPRDSWGFAWMGRAALELGDEDEALTALRQAVGLERRGSFRTPAGSVLRSFEGSG